MRQKDGEPIKNVECAFSQMHHVHPIKMQDILVCVAIIFYGASPFLRKLNAPGAVKALPVVIVFFACAKPWGFYDSLRPVINR